MDCSWSDAALLQDQNVLSLLPPYLLDAIRHGSTPIYLDAISAAALDPRLTTTIFTYYEDLFADSCARWVLSTRLPEQFKSVLSAFARILPFAPHLSVYAEELLRRREGNIFAVFSANSQVDLNALQDADLQDLLLTTFRLLVHDNEIFGKRILPSKLQLLLRHTSRQVRYLAIRVLSLYLHAADAATHSMIQKYLGEDAVEGEWEGRQIDYGFLSLWEEKRMEDLGKQLETIRAARRSELTDGPTARLLTQQDLSPLVANFYGVLVPRLQGPPTQSSALVETPTTVDNVRSIARALLMPDPVLMLGVAGSGKTSLIADAARELNVGSSMVTLHLNEQTDAKLLIGMYTTASTPGSFTWRPGVLTTAVREGRWVFIEDLDRAPVEVISVILPLIESGELLIPNRGERVQAGRGFKLVASIRTNYNPRGEEIMPGTNMLSNRLWRRVNVKMPKDEELQKIIANAFPLLHAFVPSIMNVYSRVEALHKHPPPTITSKVALGRPVGPRDLLKWCRRIHSVLEAAGSLTGTEALPENVTDDIFMEAADCFAGHLQAGDAKIALASCIAEEMHVPPQRVQYFLEAHMPRYTNADKSFLVGRAKLSKRKGPSGATKQAKRGANRPFAVNRHTLRLLEKVGVAVGMAEPVLLVGETGTGKTTVVQQLADSLGYKLTAVNLSQQSESGDLLGGFKPVNVRSLAIPLKEEFDELFALTFSLKKNQRYLDMLGKCVAKGQWPRASTLWHEALKMVEGVFGTLEDTASSPADEDGEQPKKKRKIDSPEYQSLKPRWRRFAADVRSFDMQLSGGSESFAFTFIEGNIVKAARNGEWVLLDEINLASPDTLESIADLLYSGAGDGPSLLLSETGDVERVRAHPDFRIFGAMNPATDIGKKDLPVGLRSRFTEIYVDSPDTDVDSLLSVVSAYLGSRTHSDERVASDVCQLYLAAKKLANENKLVDGANQRPHFSLRTLTRTLSYSMEIAPTYGLRRALYEGFSMSFLTLLDKESERLLIPLIDKHLLGNSRNVRAVLNQTPRMPEDGKPYVQFGHYWMPRGDYPIEEQPHYIITPFVERNMLNLVRATSTRRFPVLVQGPTSSGKTSMIEYLAKITGNKFVRINNHEHTDLQEYLGTYVSDSSGALHFQEGVLVTALREGHWIVLDELNLAPTDVLEALNRLLDDNRELLIPETQEVVRPHGNFMLFATQNPPGLYGGRKVLSRAFRNRFLELHFDDIPEDELETILRERTQIAPSFCTRIVSVYKELALLRQSSRLFEQKNSFATLRDLFRWALRDADDRDQLAINGFMLLAERVRKAEERDAVKHVIEKVMRVKINEEALYGEKAFSDESFSAEKFASHGVVWTRAMRRLYVLVQRALASNEPVLLVGETGCGKTTVCQLLAEAAGKKLHIVNAHQNTETGDLIGAQRPVRNRAVIELQLERDLIEVFTHHCQRGPPPLDELDEMIREYSTLDPAALEKIPSSLRVRIETNRVKAKALFEWADGSLVTSMKTGQYFLLDEISLADDSVLERLNSVLEPSRTLLLAEKGSNDAFVVGVDGYQFLATMNPGGDYGKRELSPALRNRFTEIWVPPMTEIDDVLQIVGAKLTPSAVSLAEPIVKFAEWFGATYNTSVASSISIRDVLALVNFVNQSNSPDLKFSMLHGTSMVYIDTLGANPAAMLAIPQNRIPEERRRCIDQLSKLLESDVTSVYMEDVQISANEKALHIGPFALPREQGSSDDLSFNLHAPTTKLNAMRILRALQLKKPVLLEGNPGVGKTTLVAALARVLGKRLTRINLSDQTDLMDLFGSDVPVEGAQAGHFAWRDGPFLKAMQEGRWVLLDEMNLASQSVLEGLNACLDHRGEVYISELDRTFKRHPNFTLFAAQNPHHQGGGRKGLPASFVNRFTVVYPEEEIRKLIQFVSTLENQVSEVSTFGVHGGPWEFNLRDTLRWLGLLTCNTGILRSRHPVEFVPMLFRQRFRTEKDQAHVVHLCMDIFGSSFQQPVLHTSLDLTHIQVGLGVLPRDNVLQPTQVLASNLPKSQLQVIESLMICIQQGWPSILVGPSGSGKTSLLRQVSALAGVPLVEFALNAEIDTMDLVGGYEQVDPQRNATKFFLQLERFARAWLVSEHAAGGPSTEGIHLLENMLASLGPTPNLLAIHQSLAILQRLRQSDDIANLIDISKALLDEAQVVDKARFEWVDGVLVEAVEQGKWLVLDNANLCSASVLDRLNSLLEPNGVLIINEHRTADGSAKAIKPHPNFRLFLTMDPRYGELSRAMRNRSIEIYLYPFENMEAIPDAQSKHFTLDSAMSRFRALRQIPQIQPPTNLANEIFGIGLDHLSLADTKLLSRWLGQAVEGLLEYAREDVVTSLVHRKRIAFSNPQGSGFNALANFYTDMAQGTGMDPAFKDVQPLHPLINESLLPVYAITSQDPYPLAAIYELSMELLAMDQELNLVVKASQSQKPSQMTRLERSIASTRIANFTKDSTYPLFSFLVTLRQTLLDWANEVLQNLQAVPPSMLGFVRGVTSYWWSIFHLGQSKSFDDAVFQVHLEIGRTIVSALQAIDGPSERLLQGVSSSLDSFKMAWQLTTGLSMERLWNALKPATPPTMDRLQMLLHIEQLADRFDALLWKIKAPLTDLSTARALIHAAQDAIVLQGADGDTLFKELTEAVGSLEQEVNEDQGVVRPFFQEEFEGICQYHDLLWRKQSAVALDPVAELLSGRASKSRYQRKQQGEVSEIFARLSIYANSREKSSFIALRGVLPSVVLRKTVAHGDATLKQINLLETELKSLGQSIARSTTAMALDQLRLLNAALCSLLKATLQAHQSFFEQDSLETFFAYLDTIAEPWQYAESENQCSHIPALPFKQTVGSEDNARKIISDYLFPCVAHLSKALLETAGRFYETSAAWTYFSIGCLLLYLPDRPFDPALKPFVERQRHNDRRLNLEKELFALKWFQQMATGQDTNVRCRIIESELQTMGEEPAVPNIARPEKSELSRLQGDFLNLLNSVVRRQPETNLLSAVAEKAPEAVAEAKLMRQNITQISRRLSESFRAYADITAPAIGILQCLDIGLSLAISQGVESSDASKVIEYFAQTVPFMGGRHWNLGLSSDLSLAAGSFDQRMHRLKTMCAVERVERGNQDPASSARRNFFLEAFQRYYSEWKEKLAADQEKTAATSGLYRYRGGSGDEDEMDEQEFQETFPTYEDSEEDQEPATESSTVRDPKSLAIRLAELHGSVLSGSTSAFEELKSLFEASASEIGKLDLDSDAFLPTTAVEDQLSASLASVAKVLDGLQPTTATPRLYNFYVDPNIPETRNLLALVHRIQYRFAAIRETWPEHATLSDVLNVCEEILAFRYIEPVAKLMTKVEKLHGHVHEWQTVASREYSAAALYDELTSLLVSWRRLELATWARLFDIENEKCESDARAWWFVAYEAVVAAPLALAEKGEQLGEHSRELLRTLEGFFSSTSLGQYAQRLRLLEQLKTHLSLIAQEVPQIKIIITALENFLSFYSRYERSVKEAIEKGRQTLEKDMKEVVLLASWKDTNIVALRESAKRSHHKLFKLVRKYRTLLSGPIDSILSQDIPDETDDASQKIITFAEPTIPGVDHEALQMCQKSVPNWINRPTRFTNATTTINVMAKTAAAPEAALDGSGLLEEFTTNIISSMAELQKQTPSTLTKDNKEEVKHLKSRKRKLFSDTLKEMRQMGYKSNLNAATLEKQASVSTIFATTISLPTGLDLPAAVSAEGYLYRLLDFMPRVRESSREHSGDLTGAEVARSVGFLEGMLNASINQRGVLSESMAHLNALKSAVSQIANLWSPKDYELCQIASASSQGVRKAVRWLSPILEMGLAIIRTHARLGQLHFEEVEGGMVNWKAKMNSLASEWEALPAMPKGVSTTAHARLSVQSRESLATLKEQVLQWTEKYPLIGFALKQVLLWTTPYENVDGAGTDAMTDGTEEYGIDNLDQGLTNSLDSILVAIQRIQEVNSSLPSSTDDAGWMSRVDGSQASALRSLQPRNICSLLEGVMGKLGHSDILVGGRASVAASLFSMALPIIRKYEAIYSQAVAQYALLHRSTCKTAYVLAKSFTTISKQGFCEPSEKSAGDQGQGDKLESGTGLGEGEGAEDISKDIQDDEDLSELAQQPDAKDDNKEDIEDEKDAVDMQHDELEGEMGDASDKGEDDEEGGSDKEEEENDMDEEAGDVDDLDPTAVDEKMWDGGGDDAEKDQEGDQSKGEKKDDEQVAGQENDKQQAQEGDDANEQEENEEDDEADEGGAQESEEVKGEEPEKADPQTQEGETLDLPEDMQMDGDKGEEKEDDIDDDMMDDLPELEPEKEDEMQAEGEQEDAEGEGEGEEQDQGPEDENLDAPDLDAEQGENEEGEKTEEAGEQQDEEMEDAGQEEEEQEKEGLLQNRSDDAANNAENAAPSEVQGVGEDQNQEKDEANAASSAKQDAGSKGDSDNAEQQEAPSNEGQLGQPSQQPEGGKDAEEEETRDSNESQAFKKLGSALERWHRQQREIRPASEQQEGKDQEQQQSHPNEQDAKDMEFEHLPDEDAQADAQALGGANEDQAHALDESNAVESGGDTLPQDFPTEEEEQAQQPETEDAVMEEADKEPRPEKDEDEEGQSGRAGAFIPEAASRQDRLQREAQSEEEDPDRLQDVDQQMSTIHIDSSAGAEDDEAALLPRSADEARHLWGHYESITRDLSLSLTEQLRLILAPTLATKMRGDFRTGKRLNIKRIIPYIASQYKRDKIWMRRSIPSKRNYQIMLAVDDSKSMGESGSGDLAFETLALVSRAMSMLEVGEISVLGFGDNVRVAHPFDKPFSSEAGAQIFQQFGFHQTKTDVKKLVANAISLFRDAKNKSSGPSGGGDMWQLLLIISDGVCENHDTIRRLVREAQEERIMIVFVVVDALRNTPGSAAAAGGAGSGAGNSIMDMSSAEFEAGPNGEMKLKMKRYLDTFPFGYYLVVTDVRELPGVLAAALRQWFAEVADTA
ncbi:midasin [Xylona heveae TC161]|uniref:Midasin n=1 Tax=Xylona heveae (strain CBS 132557 / TC161) TaxID=1328760 RepID=A0A165G0W6_XYLHT|nr:midasin [Xylona heveae TC161]KZF21610.1 midasin [Xylona heveae TC161]